MRRWPLVLAAAALVLAFSGPPTLALRNTSASMAPGWYVRAPLAAIAPGAIVAFPIPERARAAAAAAGIEGPLLKRVVAVSRDGRLCVRGDHGGNRSFDSRYYGPVSGADVIGVFVPLGDRVPEPGRGTPDKGLRPGADAPKDEIASDFRSVCGPETLPEDFRGFRNRPGKAFRK